MYRFLVLLGCFCILLSGAAFAQYSVKSPSAQKQAEEEESIFDKLPPEIQEDIIEEAEVVRKRCEVRTGMSTYHDCECMAAEFLEARAQDPMQVQSWLIKDVARKCPNIPGVAGQSYDGCRTTTSHMEYHMAEAYCTCVANKTAEMFKDAPTDKLSGITSLGVRARTQCTQELNM